MLKSLIAPVRLKPPNNWVVQPGTVWQNLADTSDYANWTTTNGSKAQTDTGIRLTANVGAVAYLAKLLNPPTGSVNLSSYFVGNLYPAITVEFDLETAPSTIDQIALTLATHIVPNGNYYEFAFKAATNKNKPVAGFNSITLHYDYKTTGAGTPNIAAIGTVGLQVDAAAGQTPIVNFRRIIFNQWNQGIMVCSFGDFEDEFYNNVLPEFQSRINFNGSPMTASLSCQTQSIGVAGFLTQNMIMEMKRNNWSFSTECDDPLADYSVFTAAQIRTDMQAQIDALYLRGIQHDKSHTPNLANWNATAEATVQEYGIKRAPQNYGRLDSHLSKNLLNASATTVAANATVADHSGDITLAQKNGVLYHLYMHYYSAETAPGPGLASFVGSMLDLCNTQNVLVMSMRQYLANLTL